MPISDNTMSVLNGGEDPGAQAPQQQGGNIQASLTDWIRHSHMISALAPQHIRSIMTQAQQSFAGMVNGAMSKDTNGSGMKARKAWEQATREALSNNALRLQTYGAIWSNPKAPIDQKMSEIQQAASEWGDETISKLAMDTQQFSTFGQIYDQMSKQQVEAEKATNALDTQIKQIEAKMPKQQGGLPPISPYMDTANDLPA